MKKIIKRYKAFLVLLFINLGLLLFVPEVGQKSFNISFNNLTEMLLVIPPIFILLGLMDVWVKKETMIKYMGEKSGIRGVLIAFFLGSAAAGPLYAAFPVAGILLKKGSKLSNVLIFIGAWSTTKIPMLMFESASLGVPFAMIRLCLSIVGILVIAYTINSLLTDEDKREIYKKAAED